MTVIYDWVPYGWSEPVYYNYGSGGNVYYKESVVYVDGKKYASSNEYYEQAKALADAVPDMSDAEAKKIEWLPLGVFAYVQKGIEASNIYLQLAVSKEGIIGGTFFNETTKTSRAVEGTVDKKTQRAAWKFTDGKNADVVIETSLMNLTKDRAAILVHFGPDKTEQMELVRVETPKDSDKPAE